MLSCIKGESIINQDPIISNYIIKAILNKNCIIMGRHCIFYIVNIQRHSITSLSYTLEINNYVNTVYNNLTSKKNIDSCIRQCKRELREQLSDAQQTLF